MAVQESEIISKATGLALLKAGRAGEPGRSAEEPPTNAVSEAARTLALSRRPAPAQAPPADKPAPQKTAPLQEDKPDDEAEDNSAQTGPEGQDAEEEQTSEGAAADADGDGQEPTITIDGEKLTAQEIRDSYLRREDFTRKTQEVAEQRRVLDHVIGGVTQSSQKVDQLVAMLEQAVGQEPDWATLAMQMQPQQYLSAKEQWTQQNKVLQTVRQEKDRAVAATLQQAKAAMFDEAARTFKPEWADTTKRQEGVAKLADYAVAEGILPQELAQLYRTPMLRILDKALKWDELQKTQRVTDKKVQGKPKPVLRPGAQRNRANAAETQLEAERQVWESNKRPDIKASNRWLQAKRAYETTTGKRA